MKTMLLASQYTSRVVLRGMLSKTVILSGLLGLLCIPPAIAGDAADINKLMRSGQYAAALSKTDAVLAKHPRDAQMRFTKGLILAEQNKSAEAIAIFSKLTEDFPDLPEPYNIWPYCTLPTVSTTRRAPRSTWRCAPIRPTPRRWRISATSTPSWPARPMTSLAD